MTKVEYNFEEMEVDRDALVDASNGELDSLQWAFLWSKSPQGEDFWFDMDYGGLDLDTELLKDMLEQYDAWVESQEELKAVDSVSLLGEHEGVMESETYELVYDFPELDQESNEDLKGLFKTREETLEVGIRSQVGGSHYQGEGIEPIDFIMSNNLSFPQGSVIKYVFRYKDKNGIEDLEKAKQYIDFMIEELKE